MMFLNIRWLLSLLLYLSSLGQANPIFIRQDNYTSVGTKGPNINQNFPDPSIIKVARIWYAFATTGNGRNIQVAYSSDFSTWQVRGDIEPLPHLGAWAVDNGPGNSNVWAPDVVRLDDGKFLLYYSAQRAGSSLHCVGAATSTNILGPYTPQADYFACPQSQGGAIDPAGFLDTDGCRYVLYKVDGNAIGHGGNCNNGVPPIQPTPIMLQKVEADGVTNIGDPVQLLDRSDADGPLIEAPSMFVSAGIYYLLFSSNCFDKTLYDISYATSSSVTGPFTKSTAPLLQTGYTAADVQGPGSGDVNIHGSRLVFHAFLHGETGASADRGMFAIHLSSSGGTLTLGDLY